MSFQEYSTVRIRWLLRPPDSYDGWRVNQRPPRIGDSGTIIHVLKASGLPDKYVVESCCPNGVPIWLGDFAAEELEATDM